MCDRKRVWGDVEVVGTVYTKAVALFLQAISPDATTMNPLVDKVALG